VAVRKERVKQQMDQALEAALEAGERPQVAFPAMAGPSPWLASGVLGLIGQFVIVHLFVALTDRRVVFLRVSRWGQRPVGLAFADDRGAGGVSSWEPAAVWSVVRYRRPDGSRLKLNVHRMWREEAERFVELLGGPEPAGTSG
jgi:hypothetical protein